MLIKALYLTFWFHFNEMARHNSVKIYNVFFQKNCMFYLSPFQSTYDDIIKSILYSVRLGNSELC